MCSPSQLSCLLMVGLGRQLCLFALTSASAASFSDLMIKDRGLDAPADVPIPIHSLVSRASLHAGVERC